MRVTETAHWLEWQDWANPILQQPYEVKDGEPHIPDVQGIGLEWDEKAVVAYLVDNLRPSNPITLNKRCPISNRGVELCFAQHFSSEEMSSPRRLSPLSLR